MPMTALLVLSPLALLLPPTPTPQHLSRRALIAQGGSAAAALALSPLAAHADVRGANQNVPKDAKGVNKLLDSLGFAKMDVPGGFSPLIQYIGTAPPANIDGQKVKSRAFKSTLLVRFIYPSGWLVETPSIDENGEAGNIGAGDYGKGDSATFATAELPAGASLTSLQKDKEFFKFWLTSQMSKDVYEDVKVKKFRPVTASDGTEQLKIDFTYTLLTRAGFTVNRKGTAVAVVADNAVCGLVSGTTELRYKEMKDKYEAMADSFRVYPTKAPLVDAGF